MQTCRKPWVETALWVFLNSIYRGRPVNKNLFFSCWNGKKERERERGRERERERKRERQTGREREREWGVGGRGPPNLSLEREPWNQEHQQLTEGQCSEELQRQCLVALSPEPFGLWCQPRSCSEPVGNPHAAYLYRTPLSTPLHQRLCGTPVLDIHLRYKYSYSLSPYVFKVSQGIALCPPYLGQSQPKRGSHSGVKRGDRSSSCLWKQSRYRS